MVHAVLSVPVCSAILRLATFFLCFYRIKALEVTNNKGFEPAMEWLLAHVDELDAGQSVPTADDSAATPNEAATPSEAATENTESSNAPDSADASESAGEVKSFKCDDW